jgi:acyl-coenzyme A thioesterase PaaI-like protein
VRYRKPHPLGVPLRLTGRLVQRRGRVAVMAGEARRADDDSLVAEAEASFMVEPGQAPPQGLSGGGASNTPMS